MNAPCVFQDWTLQLTMQQQSVLVLACRGPDNVGKFHPTKLVVTRYRASILKAAYLGRPMNIDEHDKTTFMSLEGFSNYDHWVGITKEFFNNVDELPHHYYMHLIHGAQITGYKHPHYLFRERWSDFYYRCCNDLHLHHESEIQMDQRLNDWDRQYWKD